MQISPSNGLEYLIRHFLLYHPTTGNPPMRFFPDGNPGIVVPLANSTLPFLERKTADMGGLIAYGPMEHFINIPPPPANGMLIVVLQSYSLQLLCRIPSKVLKNNVFPLVSLLGQPATILQHQIGKCSDLNEIIGTLEDFFLEISAGLPAPDPILGQCLREMQKGMGNLKIAELLRKLPTSERQLERKFEHYIGITPIRLNGILRMNHFLKLLRAPGKAFTPIQAAIQSGFYDQAHLNNNFKALTGTSPLKYLAVADPLAMNLVANDQ